MKHKTKRKFAKKMHSSEGSETDSCCGTGPGTGGMRRGSRTSPAIIPRTHATPGFWLCCLLPLTFGTRYMRVTPIGADCALPSPTYKMLTIAAIGMCVESMCFFMYMFLDTGLLQKLVISFVPGLLTSLMFSSMLQQSWTFGIFWGFAVTFCYQNAYIRVMRGLPRCFTYGEAAILMQGIMLFVLNVILNLPDLLFGASVQGVFAQLNVIMMFALFCLLIVCCALAVFPGLRRTALFYTLMVALVLAVTCTPVTDPLPIQALFNFIVQDQKRLQIILFYLVLVAATVATVWWQLRNNEKASTRVRKIFHLLVIFVYLPGILYQCAFLYIASGVALALITVVELFRVCNVPPFATTLNKAFGSFADEKDAGSLALTPFCLIIGCSLPLWITPCPCGDERELVPIMAGLLTIGIGDTAASLIGSKIGRIKWSNSQRTVEGTVAYIAAVLVVLYTLYAYDVLPISGEMWIYTIAATICTGFVEAHTTQIDNLILPLIFYAIVSAL